MTKLHGLKWSNYQSLYDLHFRDCKSILEIGVWQGASLVHHQQNGFVRVFGIDNRPIPYELPGISVFCGDVADKRFMESVKMKIGGVDAILDDASHRPYHQYNTFKSLWPLLNYGGVYAIEDLQVAQKKKWRFWTWMGFPSVPRLIRELYTEQHKWSGIPERQTISRPYEIHMYPNIVFIKKLCRNIHVIETSATI